MLIEHHNEQQPTQAQYESLMIKNKWFQIA